MNKSDERIMENPGSRPVLLIIDDDEGLSHLIRKVFNREGFRTDHAKSGKEAFEKIKEHADVLLLLDYKLPDINGRELVEALKKAGNTPPFIIMTGYGDEQIAVDMMKSGAMDYIVKGPGFIDFIPRVVERVIAELEVESKLRYAEEALRKSEEYFRAIFEKSASCIGIIDMNRNILQTNPAFAEMFGYTQQELVGKNVRDISFPEDDRENIRLYKELIQGGVDHFHMEKRYIHKNGSIVWGRLTVTLIRDDGGNPEFIVGMIDDITERKKTEASVHEQVILANMGAEIGKALTIENSLNDMLKQCCQSMVSHLNAAFSRIWVLDHAEKVLELKASAGIYTHLDGEHSRLTIDGNTKIAYIASQGKPLLTNSVIGDPQISAQEWAKREGMIAFAGHPLFIGGKVIGVMAMFSRMSVSDVTMRALASVADEIAIGIQRKKAEDALKLSSDAFISLLDSIEALVYVADMNTYEVLYLNRYGKDMFGNIEGQICWQSMQAGQTGPCPFCTNPQLLTVAGTPAGVIHWEFQNTVNNRWYDIRDRAIEWIDGRVVRLEIATDITERKQMESKLETTAITDELTGLLNRRGFFTFAENHFNLANRRHISLTLFFIDLDGMKTINDELGHKIGDQALKDTSDILRNTFRSSDIIARIGGDEFTALLTEPPLPGSIETITAHIENNFLKFNRTAGRPYELMVSIGVAHYDPVNPCSVYELLSRADTLMYEEKKQHKHTREAAVTSDGTETGTRMYERFQPDGSLLAEMKSFNYVVIRNMSMRGISVTTAERLNMDKTYEIRLLSAEGHITLTSTVVWTSLSPYPDEKGSYTYDSGLKFLDLDDDQRNMLAKFISQLKETCK